jgi:hypothetical protein
MQVMRIATFNTKPNIDDARYAEFNAWMATQPGIRALYHVREPGTERYLSISIWESREALLAMRDRVPPGGPIGIKPDAMAIYDVEQSGGPAV